MAEKNQNGVKWQAPEFDFIEKGSSWYIILSLITIMLIGIFIYLGFSQKQFSYYLAASVALAGILALFSQSRIRPQDVEFHFNQNRITFGAKNYGWDQLKSFWLADGSVHFEQKKRISVPLSAPLGNLDEKQIHDFLIQFLPEKTGGGEQIIDRINRWLKF